MKSKTALVVAAALTAFVLILIGGVMTAISPKVEALNAAAPPTGAAVPSSTATSTLAPSLTPASTATKAPVRVVNSVSSILSAIQAKLIALKLAPNGKLAKDPELVNYQGKMAYEVMFDLGAVYVDAFSGRVLYNGIAAVPTTAPSTAPASVASGGGGGGGHRGGGNNNNSNVGGSAPSPVGPPISSGGGSSGGGGYGSGGHDGGSDGGHDGGGGGHGD